MADCGPQPAMELSRTAVPNDLDPKAETVKQILSYFVHHPSALDSVEGVSRWRLLQERINRTVEESQVALEWLVAEGYLQPVNRVGSQRLFRLNIKQQTKAVRFLEGKESAPRPDDRQREGNCRLPAKKGIDDE